MSMSQTEYNRLAKRLYRARNPEKVQQQRNRERIRTLERSGFYVFDAPTFFAYVGCKMLYHALKLYPELRNALAMDDIAMDDIVMDDIKCFAGIDDEADRIADSICENGYDIQSSDLHGKTYHEIRKALNCTKKNGIHAVFIGFGDGEKNDDP